MEKHRLVRIAWTALTLAALILTGCKSLILAKGYPVYEGQVSGLPVAGNVEVIRDRWGIPHIYAAAEQDLFTALGYAHAQDRLWQMESMRRLASGRLSEIAGEETVLLDYFVRLLGLPELVEREAQALQPADRRLIEAYSRGVNAYIDRNRNDLPFEFQSLKLVPRPWRVEDSLSAIAIMAWYMQTNYVMEVLALLRGKDLSRREWDLMFPSHPGARLPEDAYWERLRTVEVSALHPAALVFFEGVPEGYRTFASAPLRNIFAGGGSNAWTVARGEDGLPVLANDPHLAMSVPGLWYLCHLCLQGAGQSPAIDVAGASIPGHPGIPIGRNRRVAWGMTNVMTDCVDLFVLRVDPGCPTRYYVADRVLEMEEEQVAIGLPKGRRVTLPLYRTIYGPVITQVFSGIEAVAALKWYGTAGPGGLEDQTVHSYLSLNRAQSAAQAVAAMEGLKILGFNILAADVDGHIAWHATGAPPLREGYSGRFPADGSAGTMDWKGFLSYSKLPQDYDPPQGWLASANNRIVDDFDSHPLSFQWSAPYRQQRIVEVLGSLDRPGCEELSRLQMDSYSLLAERLLPELLGFSYKQAKAKQAVELLSSWDRKVEAESVGAAVFEVFVSQLVKMILEDDLGEELFLYYNCYLAGYSLEDVIFEHLDSPLWDRKNTPHRESPAEVVEAALAETLEYLRKELGRDPGRWSWGRLHRYEFRHPGATGCLSSRLLNRGPYPAPGSNETVNAAYFAGLPGLYDVLWIPSLRLIVPLGKLDGARIIAPMGQSGQPGHPHYDDMIEPWIRGQSAMLPFSRQAVERAAAGRLLLTP
jgi:penicillin amidase